MTKWRWDLADDDDDAMLAPHEPATRSERGKMPVAADAKAKAAAKDTWRGRQATKKIARLNGGMRNRRNKRIV